MESPIEDEPKSQNRMRLGRRKSIGDTLSNPLISRKYTEIPHLDLLGENVSLSVITGDAEDPKKNLLR